MIFKAQNVDGYYKVAMINVKDSEGVITEDWWTIPETQTIAWSREGDMVTFKWPSVPPDQVERFEKCAEFKGKNLMHMFALDLETARKCVTVFYGEDESSTLDEYIKAGKAPALITSAPDLPDYFKAPQS